MKLEKETEETLKIMLRMEETADEIRQLKHREDYLMKILIQVRQRRESLESHYVELSKIYTDETNTAFIYKEDSDMEEKTNPEQSIKEVDSDWIRKAGGKE